MIATVNPFAAVLPRKNPTADNKRLADKPGIQNIQRSEAPKVGGEQSARYRRAYNRLVTASTSRNPIAYANAFGNFKKIALKAGESEQAINNLGAKLDEGFVATNNGNYLAQVNTKLASIRARQSEL